MLRTFTNCSKAEPRVTRFEFPSDAKRNDRISVVCTTKVGSPPFQFEWLRNGSPIAREDKISIVSTEDGSMLTFKQLRPEDAANYTCIIRNTEGMDAFTARLKMKRESGHFQ